MDAQKHRVFFLKAIPRKVHGEPWGAGRVSWGALDALRLILGVLEDSGRAPRCMGRQKESFEVR